jgi:hypothetical protein
MAFNPNKISVHNPAMVVLTGLVLLMVAVYLSVLTFNQIKTGRYIGRPSTERDTITIQGEGKVTAVPDIGEITVSLVTDNKDATKAMSINNTQSNTLVAALQKAGIDKKDLTTSNYSVYPQYDYSDGRQVLRGYEVTQSLTIKIRDLSKAGDIIALAGQSGVNQVSGLNFTIDDPEALRQQAREKALANAQAKAAALAKIAGVHLGKVVSFSESAYNPPTPYPVYFAKDARAEVGMAAPSIEQGSQDIVVSATVQYEIY